MKFHLFLLDVADTFGRRKLHFLLPFLGVVVAAIFTAYLLPEEFESQATVLIRGDVSSPQPASPAPGTGLAFFGEIVRSRSVLEALADSLLSDLPDSARPPRERFLARLDGVVRTEERGPDACRVVATHGDPHMAQRIAGTVTAIALETSRRTELRQLEETVTFYEQKLEEYAGSQGLPVEQAAPAPARPADASVLRAAAARAGADLRNAEAAAAGRRETVSRIRSSLGSLDDVATLSRLASFDPPFPDSRGGEIRRLAQRYAAVLQRYRPLHPEAQSVRRQLLAFLQRSADEWEEERDRYEVQSTQLRARVRAVNDQLAALPPETDIRSPANVEVPTAQDLLVTVRRQLEQARMTRDLRMHAGSRLVMLDRPELPGVPVRPDRPLIIGLGLFAGMLLGLVVLVAGEVLDPTIRRARDLEVFGKPVIATLQ